MSRSLHQLRDDDLVFSHLDTYSHVSPELQEAAAKRFDEAFGTKYNEAEHVAIEKAG